MFSLLDLSFVLCSRDLDILRAQRIMGFLLNYPQSIEVRKSNHVAGNVCDTWKCVTILPQHNNLLIKKGICQ